MRSFIYASLIFTPDYQIQFPVRPKNSCSVEQGIWQPKLALAFFRAFVLMVEAQTKKISLYLNCAAGPVGVIRRTAVPFEDGQSERFVVAGSESY
jgi:hypothetical protein